MNIQPRPKNNLFAAAKPRRYSGLTGSTPTQVILTPANGMPPNHTTKLINRLMTNQTHNNFFLLKIGVLTSDLCKEYGIRETNDQIIFKCRKLSKHGPESSNR